VAGPARKEKEILLKEKKLIREDQIVSCDRERTRETDYLVSKPGIKGIRRKLLRALFCLKYVMEEDESAVNRHTQLELKNNKWGDGSRDA